MDRSDTTIIIIAVILCSVTIGIHIESTKDNERYIFEITSTDDEKVSFIADAFDSYVHTPVNISRFCASDALLWIRFRESIHLNGTIQELPPTERFYFSVDSIITNGGYAFISLTYQNVTITLIQNE